MFFEVYNSEWFVWKAFCCLCMLLWLMLVLTVCVCERDAHRIGRYLCYMSKLLLDQMKETACCSDSDAPCLFFSVQIPQPTPC